jgi:hypothetical protein
MESDYYNYGQIVEIETLTNRRTVKFAKVVQKHHYAKLRNGIKINGQEGIEFDVCPEVPQKPVFDIRKTERICVIFPENNNEQPTILALRKDFPENLQHLYLTLPDTPKSLCLFEQDYRELRTTLTPEAFLNRIFSWLSRAATDEQHLDDQPLEPFILSRNIVIYNPDVFRDLVDQVLIVVQLSEKPRLVYRIEAIPVNIDAKRLPKPPCFIAIPIITKPWHSRVINRNPVSIEQLDILLKTVGVDLVDKLQSKTVETYNKKHRIFMDYHWLLLIRLPKIRKEGGKIETVEDWAFFVDDTIGELGRKLEILEKHNGVWARCLGTTTPHDLDTSPISIARPVQALTRDLATKLAGVDTKSISKISVIGAGALGSHIVSNLARQGIGKWIIVDEDQILPHNHSRHALSPHFEGYSKADALAEEINLLLNDGEAAKGVCEDVLEICADNHKQKDVFEGVDHIWDFSVSPAVSRSLALLDTNVPRSSVFLLQKGRFMVIISEGRDRKVRLDDLEIQLAIGSIEEAMLKGLFKSSATSPIRYSGSCRDITTVLSEDTVAIHSGIASQFLKNNMTNKLPSISIWELSNELSVCRINIKPYSVKVGITGKWKIRISQHAIDLMKEYRQKKLPNETGGVLLGNIDILSNIIYIGGVLPSPPDSIEWPITYIRGIRELKRTVMNIRENTSGSITYVGEWHSHPMNCSTEPSGDDVEAHKWLIEHMAEEGLPGVMLIKGNNPLPKVLIG